MKIRLLITAMSIPAVLLVNGCVSAGVQEGRWEIDDGERAIASGWWHYSVYHLSGDGHYPSKSTQSWTNYLREVSGRLTLFYEHGDPYLNAEISNGVFCGSWDTWHINGRRACRGYFIDGAAVGVWVWWDTRGRIVEIDLRGDDRRLAKHRISMWPNQQLRSEYIVIGEREIYTRWSRRGRLFDPADE